MDCEFEGCQLTGAHFPVVLSAGSSAPALGGAGTKADPFVLMAQRASVPSVQPGLQVGSDALSLILQAISRLQDAVEELVYALTEEEEELGSELPGIPPSLARSMSYMTQTQTGSK